MSATCIIHPTDFSETAQAAEAQAVSLARALGAELVILHVAVEGMLYGETPFGRAQLEGVYEAQREWTDHAMEARVAAARAAGVAARGLVRTGAPADVIVRTAEAESAAMIVIGTHGRGGVTRFLLGGVADRVVRAATCPVLTVRAAEAVTRAA
jgi:nucleotide-binding universal stress UspA family protein